VAVIDFVTIMRILGCSCGKKKEGLAGKPANPFETYPMTELA
jgi:hypothetical protein